jgi:hypothetical protein
VRWIVATLPTVAPTNAVAIRLSDQPHAAKGRKPTKMINFIPPT